MTVATMPETAAAPASKADQMHELIANIEELVFDSTGKHVFRDGRDGSFTPRAAALVQIIAEA